jgi:hypothetical protein
MDVSHPAISTALLPELDLVSTSAAPLDHGTAVASVLRRADPNALILPIRVLDSTERADHATLAAAVRQAVDRGVSVINISLGSSVISVDSVVDSPLADAVRYAGEHDVVVVAAAGNDGETGSGLLIPAVFESVIAVGAHTARGKVASFSNRGSYLDVTALGVDVEVASPGGGTTTESGSSLAAPLVAGLASSLRALHPDWSAVDVRNHILATATDAGVPGPDPVFGFGRIDPVRALASSLITPTGVMPEPSVFRGVKVRRVAGGVTVSSRYVSRIFARTPSGENIEVGPSGSYLRVSDTAEFSLWAYDRSGAPTLPLTRTLPGSKAPRLDATAVFRNGRFEVRVISQLPSGLSIEASYTAPDGLSAFTTYSDARRFEMHEKYVPVLRICFVSASESFSCRRVKTQRLS